MKKLLFTLLALSSGLLFAQEQDSTTLIYDNTKDIGGPSSIGAQLQKDNKELTYYRVPIKVMKGWYDWKGKIEKKTGLQFGIEYTSLYLQSSSVINDSIHNKNTASGMLDLKGKWTFINRKGKNNGAIVFNLSSRHAYGNLTSPMHHGFTTSGYYGLPGTKFIDFTPRIFELYYSQLLLDGKLGFIIGKIDPTNYYNYHGLLNPVSLFLSYGSALSSTMNFHNAGYGVGIGGIIKNKIQVKASITDVYGDRYEDGDIIDGGRQLVNGNFQFNSEIGFSPSMEERYFKRVSLTYWYTPEYSSHKGGVIKSGTGVAFNFHWLFIDTYMPFFRFGIGNGNGENLFAKKDIQIGNAYKFRTNDVVGLAFSWAETNIPGSKKQMTAELFYRVQITQHLALTPDLQLIINPTLNPNKEVLWYYGIRARATL